MSLQPGRRYVALGSSFAAGPGIEPVIDAAAGRSGRNYPHLVAERAGLELSDVSFSGATTRGLLRPTRPLVRHRAPAQLDAVTADTALVTMTIGGNDLGYLGGVIRAGLVNSGAARLPVLGPFARGLAGRVVGIGTDLDALRTLTDALVTILTTVHDRAPAARILVVDYLSVAGGADPGPGIPLSRTQWRQAQAMARALSTVYATAVEIAVAKGIPAEYLDCATPSRAHHAAATDPWVTGWTGRASPVPFHPNAAGMAAVADLILTRLRPGDRA